MSELSTTCLSIGQLTKNDIVPTANDTQNYVQKIFEQCLTSETDPKFNNWLSSNSGIAAGSNINNGYHGVAIGSYISANAGSIGIGYGISSNGIALNGDALGDDSIALNGKALGTGSIAFGHYIDNNAHAIKPAVASNDYEVAFITNIDNIFLNSYEGSTTRISLKDEIIKLINEQLNNSSN